MSTTITRIVRSPQRAFHDVGPSLTVAYGDRSQFERIEAFRDTRERAHLPWILVQRRTTGTAYIEIDMPWQRPLTDEEQRIITALFTEHRVHGRCAVTTLYGYCAHLALPALPLVLRRLEAIARTKEVSK